MMFLLTGGRATCYATLIACPHSRPIFNTQRQHRLLTNAPPPTVPASSFCSTATAWCSAADGNRNALQRLGWSAQKARIASAAARYRGWALRGRTAPHRRLLHGVATVAAAEAAVAQGGAAPTAVEAVLLACLLRYIGVRASPYGEDDLGAPPASGVEGSKRRGAAFGCGRVWYPRRECRSSGSSARIGSISRVRYAI